VSSTKYHIYVIKTFITFPQRCLIPMMIYADTKCRRISRTSFKISACFVRLCFDIIDVGTYGILLYQYKNESNPAKYIQYNINSSDNPRRPVMDISCEFVAERTWCICTSVRECITKQNNVLRFMEIVRKNSCKSSLLFIAYYTILSWNAFVEAT